MKLIAFLLVFVPSVALATKSYSKEKSVTHDCAKEPDVSVNVGDGEFTFTGACKKISINGSNNKVKIESVDKLAVSGSENTVDVGSAEKIGVAGSLNKVTYKSGLGGKGKPKVTAPGTGNKIEQAK